MDRSPVERHEFVALTALVERLAETQRLLLGRTARTLEAVQPFLPVEGQRKAGYRTSRFPAASPLRRGDRLRTA
jgi:hypothetical protein